MAIMVRGAVSAVLGLVLSTGLAAPGTLQAAEKKPVRPSVTLTSSQASVIPASDLSPAFMSYHDGDPAVRGTFRVNAVTIGDALNARTEKPIMIFVFDRARAASHGCALHSDIMFIAMINTPSVEGKQIVDFGVPDEDGLDVMPLGVYNEMVQRGCIGVKARPPSEKDKKNIINQYVPGEYQTPTDHSHSEESGLRRDPVTGVMYDPHNSGNNHYDPNDVTPSP
jgi:hypothetical protein